MVDNTNSSLELEVDISSFLSMPLTHDTTTKSKMLEIRLILLVIDFILGTNVIGQLLIISTNDYRWITIILTMVCLVYEILKKIEA